MGIIYSVQKADLKLMLGSTPANQRTRTWSYVTLAIVMLLWSGNVIIGRAINESIPPFTLAFVRWSGATLIIFPFARPHLRADWSLIASEWKMVLILGLSGVAAFNAFTYSGLHFTTATNGLLLQAATPPLVLLFNKVLFRQRSSILQVSGVLLSMLGVAVVVLQGNLRQIFDLHYNFGDVLILCGVSCWAGYTCLLRLRPACHPLSFLLSTFIVGVIAMAPLAGNEFFHGQSVSWSWSVLCAFAYVAILPSLVAFMLYNDAVLTLGPAVAGQTITLMPLFGSMLAAPLLGESLESYHAVGMLLILGGILIGAVAVRRQ